MKSSFFYEITNTKLSCKDSSEYFDFKGIIRNVKGVSS